MLHSLLLHVELCLYVDDFACCIDCPGVYLVQKLLIDKVQVLVKKNLVGTLNKWVFVEML